VDVVEMSVVAMARERVSYTKWWDDEMKRRVTKLVEVVEVSTSVVANIPVSKSRPAVCHECQDTQLVDVVDMSVVAIAS
jgi:hypothetical protein